MYNYDKYVSTKECYYQNGSQRNQLGPDKDDVGGKAGDAEDDGEKQPG